MSAEALVSDVAIPLMSLADDDLAVGHILTSVAGFGPELEINIALSSMGQDELGHARSYYILAVGADRGSINSAIFDRSAAEHGGATLSWLYAEEWERLLVKQYLFETADAARRHVLSASPDVDVRAAIERMEGEEQYHIDFWTTWLERTLGHGADAVRRVQSALDEIWPHAPSLFDVPGVEAIVSGGLRDARAAWVVKTERVLALLGLTIPGGAPSPLADDRSRVVDELQYVRRAVPGSW
jgi:ring-1,2-phenylacetyl-CoA epoxidase subunit PaaC